MDRFNNIDHQYHILLASGTSNKIVNKILQFHGPNRASTRERVDLTKNEIAEPADGSIHPWYEKECAYQDGTNRKGRGCLGYPMWDIYENNVPEISDCIRVNLKTISFIAEFHC